MVAICIYSPASNNMHSKACRGRWNQLRNRSYRRKLSQIHQTIQQWTSTCLQSFARDEIFQKYLAANPGPTFNRDISDHPRAINLPLHLRQSFVGRSAMSHKLPYPLLVHGKPRANRGKSAPFDSEPYGEYQGLLLAPN